jgi:glucuronate isomerase
MADLLNALNKLDCLPKTILYSLNPSDNAVIDSILGCFQASSAIGKLQHGSAWWFNDTYSGMDAQLSELMNAGLLGGFIGMLTDSRSFTSFPRHEYFRRILCDKLGGIIERGEYPEDIETVGAMVKDICYSNAANYFNLGGV